MKSNGTHANSAKRGIRSGSHLQLIPATEVPIVAIQWFMPNRIPKSELVLFEGDGGIGKTTVALDIIARATSGRPLPDGTMLDHRPNVLILAEEDRLSYLSAKLTAAEAELPRIHFIGYVSLNGAERGFMVPDDAELLRDAIERSDAGLVYLDALFNHLNPRLKAALYQDVRTALIPLARIAHESNTTIIVTRHWMKTPGPASQRGLGSADVRNISRAAVTFGKHPSRVDVPTVYVVSMSKGNYGQSTDSLLYQIRSSSIVDSYGKPFDVGVIAWIGSDQTTADDLAAATRVPRPRGQLNAACKALLSALKAGELTADQLENERMATRITAGTWSEARAYLNRQGRITRSGGGQAGPVRWSLTDDGDDSDSQIA